MQTSLFELFKIGIGPSSSHTVGPMRAAVRFGRDLNAQGLLPRTQRVCVELYGSLALTGIGHATDRAALLGLLGESPDTVALAQIDTMLARIQVEHRLNLLGVADIDFNPATDLLWHRDQMYPDASNPAHPNGMKLTAFDAAGSILLSETFYSVGGGFILSADEFANQATKQERSVPYPFSSADELLRLSEEHQLSIAEVVLANEISLLADPTITRRIDRIVSPARPDNEAPIDLAALTPREQIEAAVLTLWQAMADCIERGIHTEGTLPGGLNVRRRAPGLAARLARLESEGMPRDPLAPLDSVTLVAMAVNEENAAGGRVVTAPTNGAAGVIPAIAHYYLHFASGDITEAEKRAGLLRYFFTAAAIGILYKENASISGAEVGCQGEVGVACSMAAGGLVAALGGNNAAVEHAAEIAMEHNLGMTCDPIGGLVQIPCIERNGMGAVKAVNAARLALHDPGPHKLSLDQVIDTMYRTGMDMQSRYKETSLAGLALNIIEC
ncbi:L-serine ammonia-lyase [Granulicella cerasi]|uniref:L-serine ammonia-lyase n=1 Tax=Granulicella cerasi TaxID=741063 RepID=A0ABW1Z940_9BACT|nr:L-serine ammonia-lyase [Granulicella cerasi]